VAAKNKREDGRQRPLHMLMPTQFLPPDPATVTAATRSLKPAMTRDEKRRTAIRGAFFSEFIDMFDIYLPTVVLSPVLFYFRPSHVSPGTAAILSSLVFITTLLGRPFGAFFFGMVADNIGRRKASIYSVAGFGFITLLIALLPGYGSIGIASYWLLVLLRFLDGVCLGGGYTGAHPLAIEYAEKGQRGFVGGLILAAFPLAYVVINLVAMAMFALFPLAGPASPYVQFGWRIPFVIGALLAGVLALYYVYKVPESEIWAVETEGGQRKLPLSDLLTGASARNLLQVLVMMTGFWLTQNMITIFIPTTLLLHWLHLPKYELTLTLLICYAVLFASYIAAGVIAQRIGRRLFFVILGPLIAVVGGGMMYALVSGTPLGLGAIILLVCVMSVLVTAPWGVIITYINERFVTDVRATGFGLGFSLSVVIPSFYAFYMNWLGAIMPFKLTAVALLVIGGLLGTVGALLGPETRDVDF
ncbi:MAG TPA: MFS transporter, partial [Acidisoma sp.]|uniref:MFS transporter n=1 Tax=Acidisoma sp. TaxID=1872115 RepID=UPI002BF59D08